MTSTAPVADVRLLGLAHYAARGVVEHILARHGLTFTQHSALPAAVTADAPQTPDDLITQIHGSLKTDPAEPCTGARTRRPHPEDHRREEEGMAAARLRSARTPAPRWAPGLSL
ncbi:hypothetical protein AB0C86_04090 [Streptomyces lavendulae]|uniref:hypothetical protein n=1 Tax=Streptomyces lavendulae TaxID=1914 RepID=UPI0033F740EC